MATADLVGADPASRHRQISAEFSRRVHGTADWSAPTPVADWQARDIVAHLVEWLPGFLSMGSPVRLPAVPSPVDEPAAAWEAHQRAVQEVLDDPETAGSPHSNPHTGSMTVAEAIDRFYTSDVFMHTWDLARATGQDDTLDPHQCAVLLAGMEPMDDVLRASGQFGPAVAVPADRDPQSRLMGFIGRDPSWPGDA